MRGDQRLEPIVTFPSDMHDIFELHLKRFEIHFEGQTVLITGAATGSGRATQRSRQREHRL